MTATIPEPPAPPLTGLDLFDRFAIPDTFTDIEDLLELDVLDAVVIATPNHLHEPHVLSALAAKVHVLCERPIAMTCPPFVNPDGTLPRRLVEAEQYDEGRGWRRTIGKSDPDSSREKKGRHDTGAQYIARMPVTTGWEEISPDATPGVVLDPFAGTGTAGEVALKLGRSFYGIELYQEMLEEAVAQLRSGATDTEAPDQWSPQINIGTSVLIPEEYVSDLNVRMALYRRLASLENRADIDRFAAELIDRFGPLPEEVKHLLEIVAIKHLCRAAMVEKIEAGPKGAILTFRNRTFPNPAALVRLINSHPSVMKVRPDQKVVIVRDWPSPESRLKGAQSLLGQLAELAEAA